jgi:hypothetical protein
MRVVWYPVLSCYSVQKHGCDAPAELKVDPWSLTWEYTDICFQGRRYLIVQECKSPRLRLLNWIPTHNTLVDRDLCRARITCQKLTSAKTERLKWVCRSHAGEMPKNRLATPPTPGSTTSAWVPLPEATVALAVLAVVVWTVVVVLRLMLVVILSNELRDTLPHSAVSSSGTSPSLESRGSRSRWIASDTASRCSNAS